MKGRVFFTAHVLVELGRREVSRGIESNAGWVNPIPWR